MPLVLTLDPSTVGVRRTSTSQVAGVYTLDPSVHQVEFGGGGLILGTVGAAAGLALAIFDADKVVQTVMAVFADSATALILASKFTIISSGSTIFAPNTTHTALRRDTTVVFRPDTDV